MDFLFPEYRLDWFGAGPSSPNKTGALLALVFIVALWPTLRFRWGFWLSLPVAFVAAGLLLQTESRGASRASRRFEMPRQQRRMGCREPSSPCGLRCAPVPLSLF